jgi:glucosyl-3-phosphoglycerate synthase
MHESQRQAAAAIEFVLARRRGRQKLLLLDLDGTLTPEHFIDKLARSTGVERELQALRDEGVPLSGDQPRVAALFRFVPKAQFERVAMALPLRDGVVSAVNALRRSGFMVGVVSSGWFVVAELVRRRVFADFALAHLMQFDGEACTGEVQLNPAFLPLRHSGPEGHGPACSSEVVRHFRSDEAQPPVDTVWAVGDDLDDLALLRAAGRAFVIAPKSARLVADAGAVEIRGFDELLAHSVQAAQASQAERKLEESAQHAG